MPYFETEVDIDVDEFWNSCSKREKKELLKCAEEDGYVLLPSGIENENSKNLHDLEWDKIIYKLLNSRLRLTIEEENIIKQIANKF